MCLASQDSRVSMTRPVGDPLVSYGRGCETRLEDWALGAGGANSATGYLVYGVAGFI
jgi:hypothetical protein